LRDITPRVEFSSVQSTIAEQPLDTVSGDFDNDGLIDTATISGTGQDISWQKNDGAGSFINTTIFSPGINTYRDILAADMDGVNGLDLVVSSRSDKELIVFLNDGNGGFLNKTTYPTNDIRQIGLGDLDNDGDIDVIGSSVSETSVSIYLNDASGSFSSSQLLDNIDLKQVTSIAVDDIDGNGFKDIIVGAGTSNSVSVFYNMGNLVFERYIVYDAVDFVDATEGVASVSVVDFDKDGDKDILMSKKSGGSLHLFDHVGERTFTEVIIKPGGGYRYWHGSADFTRDGVLDIMNVNGSSLNFLITGSNNSFTGYSTGITSVPSMGHLIDLNKDGLMDIVFTDKAAATVNVVSTKLEYKASFNELTTPSVSLFSQDADGDAITYALSGIDSGQMSINPTSGLLSFNNVTDYENPTDNGHDNVYEVTVTVAAGADSFTVHLELSINDITAPLISFSDGISQTPTQSEIINIAVVDASLSTYHYGFSNDGVCDASDTIDISFTNGSPFSLSDYLNTGQYLCVKATDINANVKYLSSSHPLSIVYPASVATSSNGSEDGQSIVYKVTIPTVNNTSSPIRFDASFIGTAIPGVDFENKGGVGAIEIAMGASEANLVVSMTNFDDEMLEGDETAILVLSPSVGSVAVIQQGSASATIIDNDVASLTLSVVSASNEGDSGNTPVTFTAKLTGHVVTEFSVNFSTVTGTANTSDFTAQSGTLTFPAGSVSGTTQSFSVQVLGDDILELDETFSAQLSGATNGVMINQASAQATIVNDDVASVALSVSAPQLESDLGIQLYTFTATLTGSIEQEFTVDYSTHDDSATIANADYSVNTGSLTFPEGSLTGAQQSFVVYINGDKTLEADETFNATLSNSTQGVTISDATAQASILNDDSATVTLTAQQGFYEGQTGDNEFTFTATLNQAVQSAFSVDYATADATATVSGNDYVSATGQLNFPANSGIGTTQTFKVTINGDKILEINESFSASLSNFSQGVTDATLNNKAVAIISNDDNASVALSVDQIAKVEGDNGTVSFNYTVTFSGETAHDFTVDYHVSDGSALQDDDDFEETVGTLLFEAGSTLGTTKTFNVVVNGDENFEADETFVVSLGNISGEVIDATENGAVTTTILNDDNISVVLSAVEDEQDEGSLFIYHVTLGDNAPEGLNVNFATSDKSASVAGNDYVENSGTLVFPVDSVVGDFLTFSVMTIDDDALESNEQFNVRLSGLADGVVDDTLNGVVSVTLLNNDDASIALSVDKFEQLEGNSGDVIYNYTITYFGQILGTNISFSHETIDGNATATSGDYIESTGSHTFNVGDISGATRHFSVIVNGDATPESDEFFYTRLVNLSDGILDATTDGLIKSIIKNDDALTANLSLISHGKEGGQAIKLMLTLSDINSTSSPINFTLQYEGTADSSIDVVSTKTLVTIPIGQSSVEWSIDVTDDWVFEGDETFTVSVLSATDNKIILDIDNVEAVIVDNDSAVLSFTNVTLQEGSDITQLSVTLNNAVANGFVVDLNVDGNLTTLPSDKYSLGVTSLTFDGTAGEVQYFDLILDAGLFIESDGVLVIGLSATNEVDVSANGVINVIASIDDDNDGIEDVDDISPLVPDLEADNDGDGVPNVNEIKVGSNHNDEHDFVDSDNDGLPDYVEFKQGTDPNDPSDVLDLDSDGVVNKLDEDDDNDGVVDSEDAFPLDASEQLDFDGDGIGNNQDIDDDNDKVTDVSDPFPLNDAENSDRDLDGIGDNEDLDDNNNGILDSVEEADDGDIDADNILNKDDQDIDGDGVANDMDAFPYDPNEFYDNDNDGVGDYRDTDDDNDGIIDSEDVDANGNGTKDTLDPPAIIASRAVTVNATSLLTEVDIGVAIAFDAKGTRLPTSLLNGNILFAPGINEAHWQSVSATGVIANVKQQVMVRPLVSVGRGSRVVEGASATLTVILNGQSPIYPLNIPFSISGTAQEDDHDLTDGIITIHEGTQATVTIQTHDDNVPEGVETIIVELSDQINRGSKYQHTMSISEQVVSPRILLDAVQAGKRRTLITPQIDASPIQITARAVNDVTRVCYCFNGL